LSIDSVLKRLVEQVDGATGAIVLEADGEAVQWYALADSDRLKLRGAYVAVMVKAFQTSANRAAMGGMKDIILNYDHYSLIVREIESDCLLVLELGRSANIGQALFRLAPIVKQLREDITA
jgi:predicted regulator of Ras-like GTPase activity (Roadblock/LC7/MglB family)